MTCFRSDEHSYMIIRIALYITLRWCENTNDDDEMLTFFLFPLRRVRGIFCKSVNLVKTLPLRWITTSILICTAKNNVTTFYWEWFTAYCVGTDVFTTKLICIWWSKDLKVMLIRSREKHPYSMCNSTTAVTAAFFFFVKQNIKPQNFKITILPLLMPKVIDLHQPNIFSCPLQLTFSRASCLVVCATSVMLINWHHMERVAVIGQGPGILVCEQTDLEQFHNIIPLLQPKANRGVDGWSHIQAWTEQIELCLQG